MTHSLTQLLLQLTYSSSKLSKWSLASSQSASAPVMTTKLGSESWGRGNLISTLNWSMILRMVRPRVPMSRECTRLSTGTSTRACPLCDSHKPDVTIEDNLWTWVNNYTKLTIYYQWTKSYQTGIAILMQNISYKNLNT